MWILDWLFPKNCVGCNREGTWLCTTCLADIKTQTAKRGCADCGTPTAYGEYCADHKADHALTGLIVVQPFHKGILREAIHNFKYNGVRELAAPLGQLLLKTAENFPQLKKSLVIPIPLHPNRERERGFNQAMLLAQPLAPLIGPVATGILYRTRQTTPQAKLSHKERRTNLKGVFKLRPHQSIKLSHYHTIVLVDDVATTTTTLDEAAKVLIEGGAKSVWGIVLAKG